ncbi:hypothetical protein [Brucella intermedia]|uniref:hypothetical protein n=1 Tax=Brucella intermedia TaxID=94625 RepID=UPI00224B7DE5|nr:hypothetical protein [Brucella intermedia]
MAKFIATYDLTNTNPSPYSEYLSAAKELGWSVWILSSQSVWYRLPNTTLVGEFSDMDAAEKAFDSIKGRAEKKLGRPITVEKMIVANYTSSRFNSDQTQPKK